MATAELQISSRANQAPSGASGAVAGSPVRPATESRDRHNLSWLVQLHWWAIVGQFVIVMASQLWTGIELPIPTLLSVMAAEVAGNVGLWVWARRAPITDDTVATVMLLDAAVLTVLLDLTGGASNPFSTLYLVNVALAAVLLPRRWSWALAAASLAGFASLFVHEHFTSPSHHIHTRMDPVAMMTAHLHGMWVAFALAAVFIVFFVQRVTRALSARERELQQARVLAQRREQLASLATLAAGAAHELSTPLSTIAVVAKELQRSLAEAVSAEVRADLQLVREQVARCREILDRMAAHAGENVGEPLARMTVGEWIAASLENLRGRDRVRVDDGAVDGATLTGPPRALSDMLRGLLKNAIQASPPGAPVMLRASVQEGRIAVTVADRGPGMTPEVLSRVGEPFFTTKSPGEGMGLGLFLTRALAEQLGGEFHITSNPGVGTEARVELPASSAGERSIP